MPDSQSRALEKGLRCAILEEVIHDKNMIGHNKEFVSGFSTESGFRPSHTRSDVALVEELKVRWLVSGLIL